ncbi:Ger(x)C family spore germination C-terminal domain-containing protein [Bacillus cereus]|nr:Ger(x)C family spore germination C-terminal domain-containing protein [Bacillus cereus]MDM5237636.1 Ger(x)C family spore germination C-terminal domain-containing protein [Bacillus cereus]
MNRSDFMLKEVEIMAEHKEQEERKNQKHMFPSLPENINYIENKLQKANCDAFGIGRHLIAYHPDLWKKKNWNKDYAKVKFKPEVEVNILYSGVLK